MSISDKLTTIAENEQRVYDAGVKSEYDRFWDSYQDNGKRKDYRYAFSGNCWNDETYKPKYDIECTHAERLFYTSRFTDLYANDINWDFSKCTNFTYTFGGSQITYVGTLDTSGVSALQYIFSSAPKIHTIDHLIFKDNGTTLSSTSFNGCTGLTNINKISGCIMGTPYFSSCINLTHDSLINIINALIDKSGGTTSYKLTLGNTNLAKLTGEEKQLIQDKGWTYA